LPVKAVDTEADSTFEAELKQFLDGQVLFRGPDPEIMSSHYLAPVSELEKRSLAKEVDVVTKTVIRNRLQMIANEANEILSHIGSAPGAKWGDLICAIFTASGDLSIASSNGVLIFSVLAHHPIKYILKYWKNEPRSACATATSSCTTTRASEHPQHRPGCITPIFHEGETVAWAGIDHPRGRERRLRAGRDAVGRGSPYDEGLKISPMKCGEN
jgi:hypothetical protein